MRINTNAELEEEINYSRKFSCHKQEKGGGWGEGIFRIFLVTTPIIPRNFKSTAVAYGGSETDSGKD